MSCTLYSVKQPLFVPIEGNQAANTQTILPGQLESVSVNIPILYSLLDILNSIEGGANMQLKLNGMLDFIVQSPNFFFPEIPITYDKFEIADFVPSDNKEYFLNWKSLILQAHISFLKAIGWDSILSKKKFSRSKSIGEEFETKGDNRRFREGSLARGIGSISRRTQNTCVGSFSDRRLTGVKSQMIGSMQLSVVPQLSRDEISQVANPQEYIQDENDLNPLFSIQLNCSLDVPVFKALIMAILSKGLLDHVLGNVIISEISSQISSDDISLPSHIPDSMPSVISYFNNLNKSLLIDEQKIMGNILKDEVGPILEYFSTLNPVSLSSHSFSFIESILGPLCFHENPIFAQRATKLYSRILIGHNWDVQKTEITTAKVPIAFTEESEHSILVSAPSKNGRQFFILGQKERSYTPQIAGIYDYCYVRISITGEYEIDAKLPGGRFIVHPNASRKEIIHELPAFDHKGPVSFDTLTNKLEALSQSGVTAVHIAGAIETQSTYRLTHITDHTILSKKCGDRKDFIALCEKAKSLGIRVLVDFLPHVSITKSSRKYSPYSTLQLDEMGRLITATAPKSDLLLMNMRSTKFWDLLITEALQIAEETGVSGFYFGNVDEWNLVLPRNMGELRKEDPDGELHYSIYNILQGTVVDPSSHTDCSLIGRAAKNSPFLLKMVQSIWEKKPDSFLWIDCNANQENYVIESGLIPQSHVFAKLLTTSIERTIYQKDFSMITAAKEIKNYVEERKKRLPRGSIFVSTFGSLTTGPQSIPSDKLSLVVDFLYFLPDVPLISFCFDEAYQSSYAYDYTKVPVVNKYTQSSSRFVDQLVMRACHRSTCDWAIGGYVDCLQAMFNANYNDSIVSYVVQCPSTNRIALVNTSLFQSPLIFEISISQLSILKGISPESIIEIRPIHQTSLNNECSTQYYSFNEVSHENSSLFFEIPSYSTSTFEIVIKQPPIEGPIRRMLMEHMFVRMDRALQSSALSVLAHNGIFNKIIQFIENEISVEDIAKLINDLPYPKSGEDHAIFREALFFASRYNKVSKSLVKLNDDSAIMQREKRALLLMKNLSSSQNPMISKYMANVSLSNALGPVFFVTPELGPFSKVGGLSTMVWELSKELVNLGVKVSVISPYYNVGPKGETNYLEKYGIKYESCIDVYVPNKVEIGIHHGIVDGVDLWFIHHYSFFAAPYQTGSSSFRLQLLVVMAKGSLELLCQKRIIPSMIVTNDWMTGFVPAFARHSFGSVFDGTKFLHIFHNLGSGYSGKIWPSDGNTDSMRNIHQLPDEFVVDRFDNSFDPSLCVLLKCDQWATVSKKYREELKESSSYKDLLNQFPAPFAYSNGIRLNERLAEIAKLGKTHLEAKRIIQQQYFGESDDNKCLFVFVGRIVEQKGVHLITDTFEELNRQYQGRLQFVIGGQAAPDDRTYGGPCTAKMWDLKNRYPKNFWADPSKFFTDGLICSHAADYVLIPSLFEPSGIVQQEAFASGTPVIAFRTGGLADTVFEFDREKKTGNGFTFWAHRHSDYVQAIVRSVALFDDKELYTKLRDNARNSVLSTETVALAWAREFASQFNKIYDPEQ